MRQLDEEARTDAKRRARALVADALQRVAASHTAETTVSVVELASDDMKGRIIGREGRNIRALEHLTGVDFIIDDTPHAVVLSSFDGLRRELARMTLEKLIEDGRIHPARIEEMYYLSKAELEDHVRLAGEQAVFEANCGEFHEELVKILGRLRYRTSYGQNVLKHTLEVVHLAGIMAAELGASVKTARRAALLHDIGKAMTHEVEGTHAAVSAQLARRYGETEGVVHAVEAHHYEVQPQTVEAVLLISADAISASRPGARGESLEHYIKRLSSLEEIATAKPGVAKAYALQAGREIRVIVEPTEVDDDAAALLSHEIARRDRGSARVPGSGEGDRDPREPARSRSRTSLRAASSRICARDRPSLRADPHRSTPRSGSSPSSCSTDAVVLRLDPSAAALGGERAAAVPSRRDTGHVRRHGRLVRARAREPRRVDRRRSPLRLPAPRRARAASRRRAGACTPAGRSARLTSRSPVGRPDRLVAVGRARYIRARDDERQRRDESADGSALATEGVTWRLGERSS